MKRHFKDGNQESIRIGQSNGRLGSWLFPFSFSGREEDGGEKTKLKGGKVGTTEDRHQRQYGQEDTLG